MPPADRQSNEPKRNAVLAGEILQDLLDPLLTLDGNLQVNTANPAFFQAFHLTPELTLNRSLYEIAGGVWDIPDLRNLMRRVLEDDQPFKDYELTREFESIGRRTMLLNASKLQSTKGNDELILLAMKDVTGQKETEEALRRSQEELQMIFDSALGFAIITMDLDGRVTAWNTGAEHLLGYQASEILGRDGRIIFTPEDRQQGAADRELERARRQGRSEDERWHVCKDGSRFWGSGLVMVLQADNEIRGLMKIMRDRTAEHRLREERKAKEKELEQRVAQAMRESQQQSRQLKQASRHLHLAEQRERERLAQVLHDDLQQMLVAINMRLQMAEKRPEPETLLQEAQQLVNQTIDTARSLSRELSPSVLRQQGFVTALRWLGHNTQERHGLTVAVDADETVDARMPADIGDALFQMVRELLFNVVKHANASHAWVHVTVSTDDRLSITVDDDGAGCDPAIIDKDDANKGFGLTSIRERISLWSGQMKLGPRLGGGCRITLELPFAPDL